MLLHVMTNSKSKLNKTLGYGIGKAPNKSYHLQKNFYSLLNLYHH